MNIFDGIVSYLNPTAGVQRKRARMALTAVRKFEGASRGTGRTKRWNAGSTGVNVENAGGLVDLRNRARDLERNSAIGRRVIDVIVSNVIGRGIKTNIGQETEPLNIAFKAWATSREIDADNRLNYYGLQNLICRMVVRDGEALIRKRKIKSSEGLTVPLQIQVLEADFLDHTKNENDKNSYTVQGVKFNNAGHRVGYWLFSEHPSDTYKGRLPVSQLVPADDVEHIFRVDRAGQVRGVSWLAPVMLTIKDLKDAFDFELIRRKVASCFVGFIVDTNDDYEDDEQDDISNMLEPGTMEVLPAGRDVRFSAPPVAAGFSEFAKDEIRQIAIGVGVSYEALSSDLTDTNYSSGRMGRLEFQRNIDTWRSMIILPMFCQVITEAFLDAAALKGLKGDREITHTPPRKEFLDPSKEIEATKKEVRAGFKSLSEGIREMGRDPVTVLNEIKKDNELIDSLGLILDTDPRAMSAAGNLNPKAGENNANY